MAATVLGNLATLGYNLESSGSYTTILNVISITVPEPEGASVNMSGLTDQIDLYVPGFTDPKTFGFTCFHTAANFALVGGTGGTLFPGIPCNYKITLSDESTFTFSAFITSVKSKLDRNKEMTYECVGQVSGGITQES